MLLASGMKISAEPKPENPRAVPETKAMTQMAIAHVEADIRPEVEACRKPLTLRHHARNVPPVFFVTSATIFAATASIS